MTRAELLALAARVEAAEHGLTAAIARAVGWRTYPVGWWRAPDGTSHAEPPSYLTSLDAAASLLRPHHRVHVVQHETYTAAKVWDTRVSMFVGGGSASGEHAEARARTAAALRARAEDVGE